MAQQLISARMGHSTLLRMSTVASDLEVLIIMQATSHLPVNHSTLMWYHNAVIVHKQDDDCLVPSESEVQLTDGPSFLALWPRSYWGG